MKKISLVLFMIMLLMVGCNKPSETDKDVYPETTEPSKSSDSETELPIVEGEEEVTFSPEEQELIELATKIFDRLLNRDYETVSTYISDDYKVVFTPYANVEWDNAVKFSANEVAGFGTSETVYTWGNYDGSGEPIDMTPQEFTSTFITNHFYPGAPNVSVDKKVGNNTLEDNTSNYENIEHFVEFHYPMFNPEFEGLDWESLRFGFKKDASGEYKLTIIIHDCWTI